MEAIGQKSEKRDQITPIFALDGGKNKKQTYILRIDSVGRGACFVVWPVAMKQRPTSVRTRHPYRASRQMCWFCQACNRSANSDGQMLVEILRLPVGFDIGT